MQAELAAVPAERPARFSLTGELSGAFADLGVLVPLEAGLIAVNGLNPTATLLGAGMAYIIAGRYFGIPMPVQPLKAFAGIAIASQAAPGVIAAGALWVAFVMAVLAVTGATGFLYRYTPLGVVRGVQLGLGLLLVRNGFTFIADRPFLIGGGARSLQLWGQELSWGLPLGGGALALLLVLLRRPRLPAAVVVLLLGGLIGVLTAPAGAFPAPAIGPASWSAHLPSSGDFLAALTLLALPQIPLSLANSVIATADAARSYFGPAARRVTPRSLTASLALGNLWAGVAGGLPICHGSGGLTAHYRLGARTPAATAIVGAALVVVALLLGRAAMEARSAVPYAVYGALLAYVGWEHLKLGWRIADRPGRNAALVTAGASMVADGNLAVGAAVGLAFYGLQLLVRRRGLPSSALVPERAPEPRGRESER